MFDFFVDIQVFPRADFKPWSAVVPSYTYNRTQPFFQILVPNIDTVRFSFLLEAMTDVSRSVLFTGACKSVVVVAVLLPCHGQTCSSTSS